MALLLFPFRDVAAAGRFSGSARVTSDYVYRGYTRSDNGPAFQGNADYEHASGWFGGVWVSSVDFSTMDIEHDALESPEEEAAEGNYPAATIEISPYVGLDAKLDRSWRLQGVVAGYIYDGRVLDTRYDYYELYAQLHYLEQFSLRLGVAPNAYGYQQTGMNVDVQAKYPLTDVLELSAGAGYDTVTAVPGYSQLYWSMGCRWYLSSHIALEARYYGAEPFAAVQKVDAFPEPVQAAPIQVSFTVGF